MVKFIKKHRFLVYIFIILFNISAYITIVFPIRSFIWSFQITTPNEKEVLNYAKDLGCELSKKDDEDDTYNFYYYTKESSCDFIINFYETDYSDVLEDNLEEFEDDTTYNKEIEDFWEFSNKLYDNYYAELGKYYRVFTQVGGTVLSIESKSQNQTKVDKIMKDFNLDYKYKNSIELVDDMTIIFIIMFFFMWWQIYVKYGRKGWIVFIPIYNLICLSDDVFNDKGRTILALMPITNIIYFLSVSWNLGKFFKKGKDYCWLTMLFPYICIPLLIFSDYEFIKNKE